MPHFNIKGFNNDSLGPFKGECYVAGRSFIDEIQFSKKVQAKENIAKMAFMGLMEDDKIKICLQNKQAYKIDPKVLHQQFVKHFQNDSCFKEVMVQETKEDRGRGVIRPREEESHFRFPPEQSYHNVNDSNDVPTPNFDEPMNDTYNNRQDSFSNYQYTPVRDSFNTDVLNSNYQNFRDQNYSSYYNGPNMWHTQPVVDSSFASPFGYAQSSNVKPEQPDLVVVFDRKNEGESEGIMERRHDLEDYGDWSSRSERPQFSRQGPSYDFPPLRSRSPGRSRRNRSFSRSPSHRHRRRRSRTRSRSRSRGNIRRRPRRERSKSVDDRQGPIGRERIDSPPKLSIPSNMGRYGTMVYELAIENPFFGIPKFSTRPSPFIVHEMIAQLSIGSKLFLSATSHAKEIDAIEDAAKIAHEELLRMLEINKKMIQYQNRSNSTDQNSSGISVMNINLLVNSRKENLNPANVSAEARNPGSKNGQSDSTNQASIQPQAPQNIDTDSLLYHDLQQDDQDILRLEAAPKTGFTEKFKRGTDHKKKEQMDAMRKKRDALLNDNSENLSQGAVGKVKGEYSDED